MPLVPVGSATYRARESPALFAPVVHHACAAFDLALLEAASREELAALPAEIRGAARKRQAEFLAGRRCARAALARCAPELGEVTVPIGENRAPRWPAGLVGSITHTDGFVAAAVARARDVDALGLDTEVCMSAATAREVFRSIAERDEVARVCAALGLDEPAALTLVFSAKESLFKCLYPLVRRYFDFADAALVEVDPAARCATLALRAELGAGLRPGATFAARFVLEPPLVHTGIARAAAVTGDGGGGGGGATTTGDLGSE